MASSPCCLLSQAWILLFSLNFIFIAAERSTYIVHMNKETMPKAFSNHHEWYSSVLESLTSVTKATKPAHLYSYDNAIHGFSATLSPSELKTLKQSVGFLSAYPDIPVHLDTTHTPDFLSLNPISGLLPEADSGSDIIIGVVDTGIWPEHKSFSDDLMNDVPKRWKGQCENSTIFNSSSCNHKIIGARFFNKGLLANNPSIIIKTNSTRDDEGHGTHTASTAAGNYVEFASFFGYGFGTARGMAPHARVAMYKALWEGGGFASDVLAAMDSAIADGVDVISLSLGYGRIPMYQDPVAIGAFAAAEKGIIVSTSAGNKGPEFSTVQHGAPWILTVGASAIDRKFSGSITLGNGLTIIGMSLFPERAIMQGIGLVYDESVKNCEFTEKISLVAKDKIIFCDYTLDPNIQLFQVSQSEAAGAILVTDVTLFLESALIDCPAVVLTPDSEELKSLLNYMKNASDPKVSLQFQQTIYSLKPAPLVAAYTSRGPSFDRSGVLKPDLIAPGSRILAAWPPNVPAAAIRPGLSLSSDFNLVTGTSMACPHASGVAALLRGVYRFWTPAAIRSAMMTTATPLDNTHHPILDIGNNYQIASPLAMGSGHIDPNKALDPGLYYNMVTDDYLEYLCSMNYTKEQFMTITRSSSSYDCSGRIPDLNYPSFFMEVDANASTRVVRDFQRSVTNVGNDTATYKATLSDMKGFSLSVTPEVLIFGMRYECLEYTLHMEGVLDGENAVSYGSLTWTDESEKHIVRSPIVVTNIQS